MLPIRSAAMTHDAQSVANALNANSPQPVLSVMANQPIDNGSFLSLADREIFQWHIFWESLAESQQNEHEPSRIKR